MASGAHFRDRIIASLGLVRVRPGRPCNENHMPACCGGADLWALLTAARDRRDPG